MKIVRGWTPLLLMSCVVLAPTFARAEDSAESDVNLNMGLSRGDGDRVVLGQALVIEADQTVRSAVAVGGSVTVKGHVEEDAVAVGGNVELMPGATVKGSAVAVGGEIIAPEGSQITGDRVAIGSSLGGAISSLVRSGLDLGANPNLMLALSIASALLRAFCLFVLGLLLVSLVPHRVVSVRDTVLTRPGASLLGALIILIGTLPLCILLAITLIGIPLLPVVALLVVALFVLGMTACATYLGDKIPVFGPNKSAITALVVGVVAITLVDLVPYLGGILMFCASMVFAGAALVSKFGSPAEPSRAPSA